MRHLSRGKKFHRQAGRRKSFLRNLMLNLIKKEKIETTEARAKAIRPILERLVNIAKKNTLASRRLVYRRLINKKIANKLIDEISPRYKERKGGI